LQNLKLIWNKGVTMKISDLNYLESATEEQNVVGGFTNEALAEAKADAIGERSESLTQTKAQAVEGLFSSSESLSVAQAGG
jgi:hypothetical protein